VIVNEVRFNILAETSVKITVYWDVAPRILEEMFRRFGGACCLHHQVAYCLAASVIMGRMINAYRILIGNS
jgi:hypothetical protein